MDPSEESVAMELPETPEAFEAQQIEHRRLMFARMNSRTQLTQDESVSQLHGSGAALVRQHSHMLGATEQRRSTHGTLVDDEALRTPSPAPLLEQLRRSRSGMHLRHARKDISREHYDQADSSDIVGTVEGAIGAADEERTREERLELEQRQMVRSNCQTTLHVVLHEGYERHSFLMDVAVSVTLPDLKKAVRRRVGERRLPASYQLSWLKDGETVPLDMATWREYVFAMWCRKPWVVHAHDTEHPRHRDSEVVSRRTRLSPPCMPALTPGPILIACRSPST